LDGTLARKLIALNFDQTLESLRAHGFTVAPWSGAACGYLVSKHGAAAVLTAGKERVVVVSEGPGILNGGEVAHLLDRGYQKFLKTSKFEIPATAAQLHSIHLFGEELKQLTGSTSLFNQALGTTSDLYQYDRLKGREAPEGAPRQPWQLVEGH
jgi:hypothetical protein